VGGECVRTNLAIQMHLRSKGVTFIIPNKGSKELKNRVLLGRVGTKGGVGKEKTHPRCFRNCKGEKGGGKGRGISRQRNGGVTSTNVEIGCERDSATS